MRYEKLHFGMLLCMSWFRWRSGGDRTNGGTVERWKGSWSDVDLPANFSEYP